MNLITGRRLAQACIIWPAIFVTITFIMFYSLNSRVAREDDSAPTISETGVISPDSIVLTYGLHLEAMLLFFLFFSIYIVYEQKITDHIHSLAWSDEERAETPNIEMRVKCFYCSFNCFYSADNLKNRYNVQLMPFWNKFILIDGIICCFCMSMVGSVTLGVNSAVHTAFALVTFFTGVLHLFLFYTKIAWYIEIKQHRHLLYKVLLFICVPVNVVVASVTLAMLAHCSGNDCTGFLVNIGACAEFYTTLSLLTYCFMFQDDIECVTLAKVLDKSMMVYAPGTKSSTVNHGSLNEILIASSKNSVELSPSKSGQSSV